MLLQLITINTTAIATMFTNTNSVTSTTANAAATSKNSTPTTSASASRNITNSEKHNVMNKCEISYTQEGCAQQKEHQQVSERAGRGRAVEVMGMGRPNCGANSHQDHPHTTLCELSPSHTSVSTNATPITCMPITLHSHAITFKKSLSLSPSSPCSLLPSLCPSLPLSLWGCSMCAVTVRRVSARCARRRRTARTAAPPACC